MRAERDSIARSDEAVNFAVEAPALPADARTSSRVRRVDARRGSIAEALGELWHHRELLFFLTWRDVKIRYRQTVLGGTWAILQPLLTMLIFSVVFGRLAKIPSDGAPYPLFAFAGLIVWMFFANALTQASMSLVVTPELVTKVYFPRLTMPIASVLGGVIDFVLSFIVFLGLAAYYGALPDLKGLLIVPLFLLVLVTVVGVGLWLAALNVQYRDIRYVVPFLVTIWLFITPVAYPSTLFSEPWRTVLGVNPMTGVVEGFRWALLGTNTHPGPAVLVSSLVAIVLLLSGLLYFRRAEDRFADVI